MICFRLGIMATYLAIASPIVMTASPASGQPLTMVRTQVFSAGDRDGEFVVATMVSDVGFIIPSGTKFNEDEMMALLNAAYRSNRELVITFDANAPIFNTKRKEIGFPICSLEFEGVRVNSGLKCPLGASRMSPAMANLALAIGYYAADNQPAAMPLLDALVTPDVLKAPWRSIALRNRAELYQIASADQEPWSEAADRLLLTALADQRALHLLEPEASEAILAIAATLERLGDYEAAIAEVTRVPRKEPGDDFSATVRLASIARSRGDPAKALDLLDGLVKRQPDTGGNRFFYHRGRTLMKLGRFEQAIATFGQGISAQPDYAFARFYRGCAHASVGQFNAALNDFEAGATGLKQLGGNLYRSIRADQLYSDKLIALSRERLASGDSSPTVNLCDGFAGKIDQMRPRSKLLSR